MVALTKKVRENLPSLVLIGVLAGFAVVLAELLLMEHNEGKQVVAIGASMLGLVAAGLALVASGSLRGLMAAALLVVGTAGLAGTVMHVAEAREHAQEAREHAAGEHRDRDGHGKDEDEEEHAPPPLAPLSVSGLGVLGALGAVARRGKNEI